VLTIIFSHGNTETKDRNSFRMTSNLINKQTQLCVTSNEVTEI